MDYYLLNYLFEIEEVYYIMCYGLIGLSKPI